MQRRMIVYRLLIVGMLCLFTVGVQANVFANRFLHNISLADGLAGESGVNTCLDHSGQTWICTTNGLSVFNGKRVYSYRLDDNSTQADKVFDVCEGPGNVIYASIDKGVYALKSGDKQFRHVMKEIKRPTNFLKIGHTIYIGSGDGLWIYTNDGRLRHVLLVPMAVSTANFIRELVVDRDGTILLLSKYFFCRYNPKSGKITHRYDMTSYLPYKAALSKMAVWGDKIYLGTKNDGLWIFDISMRKASRVPQIGNIISCLKMLPANRLCIATDGDGAYLYDCSKNKIVKHYGTDETGENQIPTDAVYYYNEDANGVSWLGLSRFGMAYSYSSKHLFAEYRFANFTTRGLDVHSCYIRGKERLIGTMNGFYYVDETRNIVKYFPPEMLGGANIITCFGYMAGKYYIGTYDGGLKVMDARSASILPQTITPNLNYVTVGAIKQAPDGTLWIGTTNGLFVVKPNGGYTFYDEQNSKVIGSNITSIVFDRRGNGWVSSIKGLSMYLQHGVFTNSDFPQNFVHKGNMKCYPGHNDKLYLSAGSTAYYTNTNMTDYGKLDIPKGVLDEKCDNILDDGCGHLWIATEKGLFSMTYDMQELRHYSFGDGIRSTTVTGMYLDDSGTLWACTGDGLVTTNISKHRQWGKNIKCKAMLYNIRNNGNLLSPTEETIVNDGHKISVLWNFTSFPFSFSILLPDYSKPEGRYYEYQLDNGEWTLVKDGEETFLRYLLLGKHDLNVRLAGFPATMQHYDINVTPSWLAIVELILLIAVVTLYIFLRRNRRNTSTLLTEREQIEDALLELESDQQQEEEQEQQKYQGMKLDEKECEDIVKRMHRYLETEHAYCNPDLRRNDLAEVLHVSVAKLSQIFTLYLKENYYEFINKYRLAEFKQLVADGEYKRYTITALSEKCGFKKSNFFSTFRKVEGMTPTEYLKQQDIKIRV